jgi:hypothetical protein
MSTFRLVVVSAVVLMATAFTVRVTLAACTNSCREMTCWQVSSDPAMPNCRRVSEGDPICGAGIFPWHNGTSPGAFCDATTDTSTIQICEDCNPDCDEVPGEATNCSGNCTFLDIFTTRVCKSS